MPPAPNSFTSFLLTSSATLANDSSARTAVPESSAATARRPPARTCRNIIDASPSVPHSFRSFELPARDVQDGVHLVAVAHLHAPGHLPAVHVPVVRQVDLARVVVGVGA